MAEKHLKHKLLYIPVMAIAMMICCGSTAFAGTFLNGTDDVAVTENASYTINEGVTEGDLTLNGTVGAHVVLVKANAKAKFKGTIGNYYAEGSTKESRKEAADSWSATNWGAFGLTNLVRQYESATDTASQPVLVAINGDFGNDMNGNAPRGSVILEGNKEIASSYAKDDEFFFGYKDNGVIGIVQRITTQKGNFSEAICGSAYILRNGELFGMDTGDNATAKRQRTGIGYKTNGDVLLITVDTGITVKQLAQLMKASGCWNGLNMDGGGSTTLLTRRSGENGVSRRTPDNAVGYADEDGNHERKIQSALLLVADSTGPANNVPQKNSVTTDKNTYKAGDPIKVTASTTADGAWVSLLKADDGANDPSYFWYYIYGTNDDGAPGTWCWENGATYDICVDGECSNRDSVTTAADLPPGKYRVAVLKYASSGSGYEELASKAFTIKDPNEEEDPDDPEDPAEPEDPENPTDPDPTQQEDDPVTTYKIGYFLRGGTNSDKNPTEYTGKEDIALAPATRVGYDFDGWFYDEACTMPVSVIPKGTTGYLRLYAKFTVKVATKYEITYVLNGGENDSGNPSRYTSEDEFTLKPAKRGADTFEGWFFDAAFTKPVSAIAQGTTGNLTLYAKFTKSAVKQYRITTDVEGGSISDNVTVTEGGTHTVTYQPSAGYELESITVDGAPVDIVEHASSYTFENITADHTISVVFTDPRAVDDGTIAQAGGSTYKVISASGRTVALTKARNAKSVAVPSAVKLADGNAYKVVRISAGAFTGGKIRTVTVGKNVKKLDKYAFKGSSATKLIVRTKALKKASVKGSLKGSKVKTVQVKVGSKKVNKKYVKKYKKIFTKKNAGKKVSVR